MKKKRRSQLSVMKPAWIIVESAAADEFSQYAVTNASIVSRDREVPVSKATATSLGVGTGDAVDHAVARKKQVRKQFRLSVVSPSSASVAFPTFAAATARIATADASAGLDEKRELNDLQPVKKALGGVNICRSKDGI